MKRLSVQGINGANIKYVLSADVTVNAKVIADDTKGLSIITLEDIEETPTYYGASTGDVVDCWIEVPTRDADIAEWNRMVQEIELGVVYSNSGTHMTSDANTMNNECPFGR